MQNAFICAGLPQFRLSLIMRCAPFIPASPAKIALVGEAPGKDEALLGVPFVGSSGQELGRMLRDAGIEKSQCYQTNVFMDRPPDNNLLAWCDKKKEVSDAYQLHLPVLKDEYPDFPWPERYSFDKIKQGKYIHPRFLHELPRLKAELERLQPNLIIALGGTACWALFGMSGIEKIRGACTEAQLALRKNGRGIKVLPTYHPAYILRNWSDRIICVADFEKASREAEYQEVRRPQRFIHVAESIADLWDFYNQYITSASHLATDIEAHVGKEITCIGFAPSPDVALVIPFTQGTTFESYWSEANEIQALKFVRMLLQGKWIKVFQNGMFDIQYIIRFWRILPRNCVSDTMLAHHALQPELPKGLGFFGSIYTDEASWKLMRKRAKDELQKKDE